MVLLLLCILIAILTGAAIAYGIYRKRKLKEYELAHTEIPDLMRAKTMCLEGITVPSPAPLSLSRSSFFHRRTHSLAHTLSLSLTLYCRTL